MDIQHEGLCLLLCFMGTEKEVEKMTKLTITAKEATDRLAMAGIRIGYEKLRAALKQGKLPFGFSIDMEAGQTEFVIFSKDLDDFIRQHGGEPA